MMFGFHKADEKRTRWRSASSEQRMPLLPSLAVIAALWALSWGAVIAGAIAIWSTL
jgi:hypothetical protein